MTDQHGTHGDHGHEEASHDHDAHEHGHDLGGHGHDEHGHDGHDEHWGDYNSQPPPPSTLPAVGPFSLAIMGAGLAVLLFALAGASFRLSTGRLPMSHATAERAEHAEHKHE